MCKKAFLALTLCYLFFCNAYAQSIQSISGNVVNADRKALFGNAVIVSPEDSSIITGTSFLEGKFELHNLNDQKVLLKLTSLEFQDTYRTVDYDGRAHVDLGDIVVAEASNELEEVVVAAKSSLVKERADGSIEVTVANTTLATSTSVDEILRRSPNIVSNAEGEIAVFGKGAAILFINGVRVASERLSTLSPSDIKKIEIISNPGSRYDAEGNAVINIITKRNADEGSKGMVKNYVSYTDFAGFENRTDVNYSYSRRKWSLNGNYGLTVGNERNTLETTRTRDESKFFSSDLFTDWQYESENFSNYGLGIQYNFEPDRYFSLAYTGAYEDLGGNQLSSNTIITDDETGKYNSTVALDDLTLKNTINTNYYAATDTLGSHLFVGGQYSSYREHFDNDIEEFTTVAGTENKALINNLGESNIGIMSMQADYSKVLRNQYVLEVGGKIGHVDIEASTTFFDLDENQAKIRNEQLSSNFEYNESVPAGYVNFKGNVREKINYSLGARVELTDYTLLTSIGEGGAIKDRYVNVFPNASVDARLSDKTSAYFTYASRINRPSYQWLNPFITYQDAFTSIQGNPNIQPAKVHAFEVGGAVNDWSVKLGYNYTIDPIDAGAFQSENDPRVYILQRTNLSRKHTYFASMSQNANLKWWRSINTATVSYDHATDDTGVFGTNNSKPYYYLYTQNSFEIKDWITLYLTAWYLSNKQDGINFERDYSSVNVGVEKKLLREALTCNLDFNDIFHKVRAAGEYRLGTTDIVYGRKFSTNYVRFSVSYSFGKLKESNYQNKNVGASETERAQ